jgi:hypothetical protein
VQRAGFRETQIVVSKNLREFVVYIRD